MTASAPPYRDRSDAGRALAPCVVAALAPQERCVVLGLPRGGVPVAAEVAAAVRAPLDVLVVRKIGDPLRPELALGALAGVGPDVEVVWDDDVLSRRRPPPEEVEEVHRRESEELRRRERAYRAGRPPVDVSGRTAVLVDDGLATGSTMRAAVAAVRRSRPSRVLVAVPVGATEAVQRLRAEADDVVCPRTPRPFRAVGYAYGDFSPTPDEEVLRALAAGRA